MKSLSLDMFLFWDFWGFESLRPSLSMEVLPVFLLTCWWSSHHWLISGGNKYLLLINKLKIRTQLEVITTQFWNFGSQVDGLVAFYPTKNKFCNFQNKLRKQGLNDI